ncbi:hypothetical protein ACFSQT_32445 [Mesorhizobium calcicola]|uniref:Uncharacterized protein n=1 Tax=Mesorhizobium calcicola TaxID=1300310 RepID=A0ABW4WNG3_9HYPH
MAGDLNRLEQAARMSMGGFQDQEAPASPLPAAPHASLRLAGLGLTAVIIAVVLFQLVS